MTAAREYGFTRLDPPGGPENITAEDLAEMTTTELQALIFTTRLSNAQLRALRAEIKSREI